MYVPPEYVRALSEYLVTPRSHVSVGYVYKSLSSMRKTLSWVPSYYLVPKRIGCHLSVRVARCCLVHARYEVVPTANISCGNKIVTFS